MKRKSPVFILVIPYIITLLIEIPLFCKEIEAISNPKPNIIESSKSYIRLMREVSCQIDFGNGEYLFAPSSISAGSKDSLFVYDGLQAKIFKLNSKLEFLQSFGGKGNGPGEFSGTGKTFPVFIAIGQDGNLHANDVRGHKIITFSPGGKLLREFRYNKSVGKAPLVDEDGKLEIVTVTDRRVNICDNTFTPLFSTGSKVEYFDYLFSTPESNFLEGVKKNLGIELSPAYTKDSKLLLYYFPSSTMMVIQNSKLIETLKLWPQQALKQYRVRLQELKKEGLGKFIPMFSKFFPGSNEEDGFYLHFGNDRQKRINALYQFNLEGEVKYIYYIDIKEEGPFTRFEAKFGERFIAVEDDTLISYRKEEKAR